MVSGFIKMCERQNHVKGYFYFVLTLLFLATPVAAGQPTTPNVAASTYHLGPGDKIQITVYDEPDLSLVIVLPESGVVSYPFLGDLKITGLTAKEIETLIDKGLRGPYLVDPKISVSVQQYRPFYISGEVKQSGGYPYQPGLTLRRAVSLAGGFTERASKAKISVIRDSDKKQRIIGLDDLVYPGDTITVEQSFF